MGSGIKEKEFGFPKYSQVLEIQVIELVGSWA